ncbi:MAG TPA: DinB family protein, partial [Planctomycetota bacterium]|nr:DinB family protein [Planctomycetota bacterium]
AATNAATHAAPATARSAQTLPDAVGPNIEVLEQTLWLLAALDDAQYAHVERRLSSASIGAHVRHNLDHYRLFLAGLGAGLIDYDARDRHTPVESDRGAAAAAVRALVAGLAALPREALGRTVRVRQQGGGEPGRFDGCESRVDRELLFLQSHAVHHHALIAVLARAQGVAIPESFGMAPSTIEWLRRQAAACAPAASQVLAGAGCMTEEPQALAAAMCAAAPPSAARAAPRG